MPQDTWLRLLPADPAYTPRAVEVLRRVVAEVLPADLITVSVTREVFFMAAPGTQTVSCPRCQTALDPVTWAELLSGARAEKFRTLDAVVPCCRAQLSLNDLTFARPAAFARCMVEVRNPQVTDLSAEHLSILERVAGCRFRLLWTRP